MPVLNRYVTVMLADHLLARPGWEIGDRVSKLYPEPVPTPKDEVHLTLPEWGGQWIGLMLWITVEELAPLLDLDLRLIA